jgi:hypothetical protein
MKNTFSKIKSIGAIAALALVVASCSKESVTNTGGITVKPANATAEQKRAAMELANRAPSTVRVYDENDQRFIDVDFKAKKLAFKPATERDFNFATPNNGWNYSNSSDVAWVPAEGGGGILFIGPGSFGGNSGGTVVAGSSALDINYTFCFAADESALGFDLFDTGAELSGISGVVGIAGDFEALLNEEVDSTANFNDFFQGFAAYFVYADEAQGSYPILNWFDDLDSSADDLADKGFSYVFDFSQGAFYLSESGNMNVSGGSMSFNGEYLGIEGLFDALFEESEEEPQFTTVSGFGTMGCN